MAARSAILVLFLCRLAAAQRPPASLDATAVSEGREIYNRSCTMCHGLEGTLGDRGPALVGDRRFLRTSPEDLFDAIRNGIGGTLMPPANLSEDQAWKVVAYIRSLRATAGDSPVDGDLERGAALFWGKGECGKCHMIRGRGGILGPDLSNIGGARRRDALRAALVGPRTRIPRGYQPVRVSTKDGRSVEGLLKNENNFSLQVLGLDLRLYLLMRDELREVVYESKSAMPADYDRRLTEPEVRDLVAFMSRQNRGKESR